MTKNRMREMVEIVVWMIMVATLCIFGYMLMFPKVQEEPVIEQEEVDARQYSYLVSYHLKTKDGRTGFGNSDIRVDCKIDSIASVERVRNHIAGTNEWTVVIINMQYLGRE